MISELLQSPFVRERRRDTRYSVPALTLIAGHEHFTALDWSISGSRVKRPVGLNHRDRLSGMLLLEGELRTGGFVAEVARLTEAEIGLRWLEVTGPIAAAMA